ncbi:hypothetical protein U1Q18_040616 [Sarracenia purpurea var. burkii]
MPLLSTKSWGVFRLSEAIRVVLGFSSCFSYGDTSFLKWVLCIHSLRRTICLWFILCLA